MHYQSNLKFYGKIASYCEEFIKFKRLEGYKYEASAETIARFSKFSLNYEQSNTLISKELAYDWIALQPGEQGKTAAVRETTLRQFAKYLVAHGENAYILPHGIRKLPKTEFTPYIFTHDEIKKFFHVLDTMKVDKFHKNVSPKYALMFRILYGTGMRISEVLSLKMSDLDLAQNVISVWDTKFHKSRLLPMSDSLSQKVNEYVKQYKKNSKKEELLFASVGGREYSSGTPYEWFRKAIWRAEIHYRGKAKGPRVHDLRHTFAVHSFKQWVDKGKDIYTLLPILCTYLGHGSIHATEYYLRLTSEIYPDILNKVETDFGEIVPLLGVRI